MNPTIEVFNNAYEVVNKYKRFDIKSKSMIVFPMDYIIPKIDGARYQRGKSILTMYPKDYEYFLYQLHNMDDDILYKILLGYLHYWKIRSKDRSSKIMRIKYKEVIEHYKIKHNQDVPILDEVYTTYYISFYVGSIKVYKIGYSFNPTRRFKEIINSVEEFYPLVSVGSLKVIETATYPTEAEALAREKAVLATYKDNIPKSQIFFLGGTEGFSKDIRE